MCLQLPHQPDPLALLLQRSSDTEIGQARIPLSKVYASKATEERRVQLVTSKGKSAGELLLMLTFKPDTATATATATAAARAPAPAQSSLTACRHQALAAVSPPIRASQNAWVHICPQSTKSMYQLIGMHLRRPSSLWLCCPLLRPVLQPLPMQRRRRSPSTWRRRHSPPTQRTPRSPCLELLQCSRLS
jgi:hypothetical protein